MPTVNWNGRVYIFGRNHGGENNWGDVARIRGNGTGWDDYGYVVAIDRDTLVVGDIYDRLNSGAVDIFRILREMQNDFDGDGKSDLAVYCPSGGNWYIFKSAEGFYSTTFGYAGTKPISGDFDGDGRSDFGCYYAPDGTWYVFQSTDGFWTTQFGYTNIIRNRFVLFFLNFYYHQRASDSLNSFRLYESQRIFT